MTSPTFALVQSYEGRIGLHHLDVYRLAHISETADLGLSELLDDEAVTLIEWGDMILSALPREYLHVRLAAPEGDDASREILITARGAAWRPRLAALARALERWIAADAAGGESATGGAPC